jgi:tRNA threonylcarbamoyladenosine biosynthesis protein TsaE
MEQCHFRLETHGAAQTRALGARLARMLGDPAGAIIALAGDLGAGKTTFTQGLAQGLGISALVTSPTFVLINRYVGVDGRVLQHADCYRLSNAAAEMWDVGLVDLFASDDIVVVEWADRIPGLFPDDYLEIAFAHVDENRRQICLTAHGARYAALLEQLAAGGGMSNRGSVEWLGLGNPDRAADGAIRPPNGGT